MSAGIFSDPHDLWCPRQELKGSLSRLPYPQVEIKINLSYPQVEIKHFITLLAAAHSGVHSGVQAPKTDHVVIWEAIKETLAPPVRYSLLIIPDKITNLYFLITSDL